MAVRSTGQFSFADALTPRGSGGGSRLDRLSGLVKWYRFEKLLSCLRDGGAGRPAYPSLLMIARRRAAVETTFATLKRRMGLRVIRYRGLAKASTQVTIAAIAFNLRRWAALSTA